MKRCRARAGSIEGGFTLTELMVVVSIIGILVTLAIVYMRPRVTALDVVTHVGEMAQEGARRAVALGPVRPDVVSTLGITARTMLAASQTGATVTFTLYLLQENPVGTTPPATWAILTTYDVDGIKIPVQPVQWATGVGTQTMSGLTTAWDCPNPNNPTGFFSRCKPNGTCESRTLFFQATIPVPPSEQQARLSIMPLGGAIYTVANWNLP